VRAEQDIAGRAGREKGKTEGKKGKEGRAEKQKPW
jgi:hypothetical protein